MDFQAPAHADPFFIHAAVFTVAAWLHRRPDLSDGHLANVVRFLRSPGLDPEFAFLFLQRLKRPDLLVRLRALPEHRALCGELAARKFRQRARAGSRPRAVGLAPPAVRRKAAGSSS